MKTQTTTTPFQPGDEIAVLNEYSEADYGTVISVKVEKNGYPTTTVNLPTFRNGKGYNGVFATERLIRACDVEVVIAQEKADREFFKSVTGWR